MLDKKLRDTLKFLQFRQERQEYVPNISWQFIQDLSTNFSQNHKCEPCGTMNLNLMANHPNSCCFSLDQSGGPTNEMFSMLTKNLL